MSQNEQQGIGSIVIGEGVSVSGSLVVPAKAVVNGQLEGDITADDLLVGATGRIVGTVRARNAEVYGEIHEKLQVAEHLLVRGIGKITGNVSYGEIQIERGGMVHASIVPADQSKLLGKSAAAVVYPGELDVTQVGVVAEAATPGLDSSAQ